MYNTCYTLDVLSDGSEFTGPTLFLSVWRQPKRYPTDKQYEWIREEISMNPPLARYAIAGLGDATARLCADQRLKLAPTKAVFIPSLACSDGLSALLLTLLSSGSASLHVVSSDQLNVEELAGIMLGESRHLNIQTCLVPQERQWWKVYSDKYLQVHARAMPDPGKIVYLYTLLHFRALEVVDKDCDSSSPSDEDGEDKSDSESESDSGSENESKVDATRRTRREYTLAIFPPSLTELEEEVNDVRHGNLPLLDSGMQMKIDHVIALDIRQNETSTLLQEDSIPVFWTSPSTTLDRGLLIRSQQLSRHFSNQLPSYFPFAEPREERTEVTLPYAKSIGSNSHILMSCTSILFQQQEDAKVSTKLLELDRRSGIWNRPVSEEWSTTVDSLRSFVATEEKYSIGNGRCDKDENEINLDEESQEDENEINLDGESSGEEGHSMADKSKNNNFPQVGVSSSKPQLVVLGTGCASPSAIRGASGYALVLPGAGIDKHPPDIILLDCGEGAATVLNRSCNDLNWRKNIRGIWISHAHLDHYGGLPRLIRSLTSDYTEDIVDQPNRNESKRRRLEKNLCQNIPWVMAPPKVLQYLDVLLGSKYGKQSLSGGQRQLFVPLLQLGPSSPPGPWSYFQNIKVNHNCCPAYGLLLRLQDSAGSWLCFSGDTRPCSSLIATCRRQVPAHEKLLLVHEATFEDTDQDQAHKKKHSTVSEAISVSSQIEASRLLLTHFSQRYVSTSKEQTKNQRITNREGKVVPVGFAMDGLRFNL